MFEVQLLRPLPATPVGGSRPVVLCSGSRLEVRVSPSGRVAGVVLGGRRFEVPVALLRPACRVLAPQGGAPVAAPVRPVVAVEDFSVGAPVPVVGWEPRHRVRPGASSGAPFRAPAPRRAGAASRDEILAAQRRSPLWAWRASR